MAFRRVNMHHAEYDDVTRVLRFHFERNDAPPYPPDFDFNNHWWYSTGSMVIVTTPAMAGSTTEPPRARWAKDNGTGTWVWTEYDYIGGNLVNPRPWVDPSTLP